MKRALVLSLICVLGLAFSGLAATLSGSWDTDVTIDPQETNFNDAISLLSTLTVAYQVGDWTFTSVTDLSEAGWTDQDFTVAGVLGAFTLSSGLDFVPASAAFGSWTTTAGVSIAGVTFGATFKLEDHDTWLTLTGSGVAGDVTVGATVTFGDDDQECDLDWSGVTIDIGFPFCCADIDLAVKFDCSGFVSACFSVTDIVVPNVPYMTLDADLCFTMAEKTLVLTPAFDFGTVACFDLYFDVDSTGNLTIQDISIVGIGLTCTVGSVDFTGLSWWGTGTKPGILYGTEYWEAYQIKTLDDGCCGPFGFDLTFYFLKGGVALFDIAEIDANMSLQVASQFKFNMGLNVDVNTGAFAKWTVGFLVTW